MVSAPPCFTHRPPQPAPAAVLLSERQRACSSGGAAAVLLSRAAACSSASPRRASSSAAKRRAPQAGGYKKNGRDTRIAPCVPPLGGDYLLSHFRSTIGVAGLNFSVRNGKRWIPRAVITLVSSLTSGCALFAELRSAYGSRCHRRKCNRFASKRSRGAVAARECAFRST